LVLNCGLGLMQHFLRLVDSGIILGRFATVNSLSFFLTI
jgi:hypothetical protein